MKKHKLNKHRRSNSKETRPKSSNRRSTTSENDKRTSAASGVNEDSDASIVSTIKSINSLDSNDATFKDDADAVGVFDPHADERVDDENEEKLRRNSVQKGTRTTMIKETLGDDGNKQRGALEASMTDSLNGPVKLVVTGDDEKDESYKMSSFQINENADPRDSLMPRNESQIIKATDDPSSKGIIPYRRSVRKGVDEKSSSKKKKIVNPTEKGLSSRQSPAFSTLRASSRLHFIPPSSNALQSTT